MSDQTPAPAPVVAPTAKPTTSSLADWPTIIGIAGIVVIANLGMYWLKNDAHDIALGAISGILGWLGHKTVQSVRTQ